MLNMVIFACRFLLGAKSVKNRKQELELRPAETELKLEPGWWAGKQSPCCQPQHQVTLLLLAICSQLWKQQPKIRK